jgi:hypothetical protein
MRAVINEALLLGEGVGKPLLNPKSGIPICEPDHATRSIFVAGPGCTEIRAGDAVASGRKLFN